jgi:hypothetical protein
MGGASRVTRPVSTTGLTMPPDFAVDPYEAIFEAVLRKRESAPDAYREFAAGWCALSYRFAALATHDEAFSESARIYGLSPPHPARHRQEDELFAFFVAGISALETFAYGTWAMIWATGDADFALTTPAEQRRASVGSLRNRLVGRDASGPLALALGDLTESTEFADWADVRNALTHRGTPGRHHRVGGEPEPMPWGTIHLDERTTTLRRAWLATTLGVLLSAAEVFASEHFRPSS